jgi:monoterpene epsilon-lactone hydrolase
MPSIQSRLFSRLANRSMQTMFVKFDVERLRKWITTIDRFGRDPSDVEITPAPLAHCDAEWIRSGRQTDRVVVYFPGGAWVMRTPRGHRRIAAEIAKAANADVLLVFYRLAPEHPFPAALEDCMEAYTTLLEQGIDASRITIGGDSAGGNLALATLLALRDSDISLPAGAFTLSACTDMGNAGSGIEFKREDLDEKFPEPPEEIENDPRLLYVAGDEDLYEHPYVSPLRGDLRGLCPVLLQAGGAEWLMTQSTDFAERARSAGVHAEVEVWEGQPHVWHIMSFPESERAVEHLGDFIRYSCP